MTTIKRRKLDKKQKKHVVKMNIIQKMRRRKRRTR